jgi:hypothetical protein
MEKRANTLWNGVLAVGSGFLAVIILSLAADEILHILKVYPPWGQPMPDPGLNLLALGYRMAFTLFGGWLAARISARAAMGRVWTLGAIGTGFGILGAVATWNLGFGPHWYPVALAVTAAPCTWLGGKLALRSPLARDSRGSRDAYAPISLGRAGD